MNVNQNTLVFKLSKDNSISDLQIKSEVKNFIADLKDVNIDVINKIKDKFITFDKNIKKSGGSFVIVSKFVFDEKLVIVPTLQEAYDYIEMEEIERQLKF